MKIFVNLVQILLIAGIVYPAYAIWNNNRLIHFCDELKPNMTKQHLLKLADQKNIRLNLDNFEDTKWYISASALVSFSDSTCQIRGMGNRVASAKMAIK